MSDEIKINGVVEKVLPLETFASGFTKRVLVVNTGGDYPQTIPVEFVKDKTKELDSLKAGQEVIAFVNLRGSEYNGKYYANIQGWRLDKVDTKAAAPKKAAQAEAQADEDEDDIPF